VLQEAERVLDVLVAMKGHKGAREKFADGLAAREARDHVALAVFEDEDARERGAVGRGEHGFAVPGRAVHAHSGRAGGTVAAIVIADDDAVVAEHFDFFAGGPEARGRALARAGVADEESWLRRWLRTMPVPWSSMARSWDRRCMIRSSGKG
jgi:hypothetical protein